MYIYIYAESPRHIYNIVFVRVLHSSFASDVAVAGDGYPANVWTDKTPASSPSRTGLHSNVPNEPTQEPGHPDKADRPQYSPARA